MSTSIELPEPLYAEIYGYALREAVTPQVALQHAWEEFRSHHMGSVDSTPRTTADQDALLDMIHSLSGSISLPAGTRDDDLIATARSEKYGPV